MDSNPRSNVHHGHLIDILIDYTEDARQVRILREWVDAVKTASTNMPASTRLLTTEDHDITQALTGAIYDGLRCGNWPWTNYTNAGLTDIAPFIAQHLAHCYQGEYFNSCKYGDIDCPARVHRRQSFTPIPGDDRLD